MIHLPYIQVALYSLTASKLSLKEKFRQALNPYSFYCAGTMVVFSYEDSIFRHYKIEGATFGHGKGIWFSSSKEQIVIECMHMTDFPCCSDAAFKTEKETKSGNDVDRRGINTKTNLHWREVYVHGVHMFYYAAGKNDVARSDVLDNLSGQVRNYIHIKRYKDRYNAIRQQGITDNHQLSDKDRAAIEIILAGGATDEDIVSVVTLGGQDWDTFQSGISEYRIKAQVTPFSESLHRVTRLGDKVLEIDDQVNFGVKVFRLPTAEFSMLEVYYNDKRIEMPDSGWTNIYNAKLGCYRTPTNGYDCHTIWYHNTETGNIYLYQQFGDGGGAVIWMFKKDKYLGQVLYSLTPIPSAALKVRGVVCPDCPAIGGSAEPIRYS